MSFQTICPCLRPYVTYRNTLIFTVSVYLAVVQVPVWRTITVRFSATEYLVYLRLFYTSGGQILCPLPEDIPSRPVSNPLITIQIQTTLQINYLQYYVLHMSVLVALTCVYQIRTEVCTDKNFELNNR
jgi:hypothetical protein